MRDNGICQICGKKIATKQRAPHPYSASLDHIIPLAKGGTHEPKNVRLVHFICNSLKGDRTSVYGDQLLLFG
jgi:5-methylcytosine-specific restriction endonuclease McrA